MQHCINLHGLYGISDETLSPYEHLPKMLQEAILGGLRIFQLRDKCHSDQEIQPIALELMHICKKSGVQFILNDRYALAKELGCGVHLGKEEWENWKLDSKKRSKELRFLECVGISCYDSLEYAKEAKALGADYVAFGSCFESPTKPLARCLNLDIFLEARNLEIPVCAIGGITPLNAHQLKNIEMIAVISSLWNNNLTRMNAQNLLKAWNGTT
ncbi:hypothetical protein CCZ01_05940 [Helicobacter monodelphidis]|uniref:thiamine phosphate synthase n=1 Tax=Helicobacter sp. 15-1451 TaxID=2004995 RepID=UPI000DCD51B0|nr:thiamine phosphate synthase [Helicobacter sp. 15-1451]RAX57521.1 hypothetical protein CCZ01_05940 [Helicobacter sp. 15-1451]